MERVFDMTEGLTMGRRYSRCEVAVWEYLWGRFEAGSGSPSVREIARATHYRHSQCANALHTLEAKGAIRLYWNGEKVAHRGVASVQPPTDEAARRRQRGADIDFA